MQHRNFSSARKFKKMRFCENFAFATLATSCCVERIETRSKRATSVGIELTLQLVACAASDAAQEFFKCLKMKKIRLCEKLVFAPLGTRVAARNGSKPAQNVPRPWELSWLCNWFHAQLP